MAPARLTGVGSAEFATYRQLAGYGDAIPPPPGLETQAGPCIRPPPGLEPPCGVWPHNDCSPKAATSQQDFLNAYQEFLQLRQERQECEGTPTVPSKPPGCFQDVSRSQMASIDEFDKMAENDCGILHEATEQQSFSRAKASTPSCELNPRVSGNPIGNSMQCPPGNFQGIGAGFSLAFSPSSSPTKPPSPNEKFQCNAALGMHSSSAPQKPPGVFLRSGSKDSLASTAATLTGDVEDSFASIPAIEAVEEATAVPFPSSMQSAVAAEESAREANSDLCMEPVGKDGHLKFSWRVHGSRLTSKDQQIISPSFEITPGCSFKLMLKPTRMGNKKGQSCFKKARGFGSVDLKMVECVAVAPTLRFCITVGEGSTHGPIEHNFNDSIIGGPLGNNQKFDFTSAVDPKSSTFAVNLEVLPSI